MTTAGYADFGGGDADVTTDLAGNAIASVELTVWTAFTGGTKLTDILKADGTTYALGKVVSDSGATNPYDKGRWSFQAPENNTILFMDRGYGKRWAVWSRQALQDIGTISDVSAAAKAAADAATLAVAGKLSASDAAGLYVPLDDNATVTGAIDFTTAPTVNGDPITAGAGGGPHAETHAEGGTDPVSPDSIGAYSKTTADARFIRTIDGSGPDPITGNVNTAVTRATTAEAILAAAEAVPKDVFRVMDTPPTIAISAASAATSITGGIKVAPKQVPGVSTGRPIDTEDDPHFQYIGVRPGHLKNSSVNKVYADLLTGGASNSKRDMWRIRFLYTGSEFEAWYRVRTAAVTWRLWIDGVPMTSDNAALQTGVAGSSYYYKVTFADARPRVIMLEMYDPEFGGIVIQPTAQITRVRVPRRTLHAFGDSITDGSSGVARNNTWVQWASRLLSMDWIQTAIGGTGYLTETSPLSTFRDRLEPDVLPQVTDLFVMFGGFNDIAGFAAPDIAAEAGRCLDIVLAGMPTTAVILVGAWQPSGTVSLTGAQAVNNALRAVAEARNVPFIDLIDPGHQAAATPDWVASKTYYEGDQVVRSGLVYKALVQHANVSFTASQWRQTSFITGTGKIGATVGDGNADVFINTDGIHPTLDGHKALGFFLYQEIVAALRIMAGVR